MIEGLPRRVMYICNKQKPCKLGWPGCPNDECSHTEDVNYAKNGPVKDIREYDTRFRIVELGGLLWYWEKE